MIETVKVKRDGAKGYHIINLADFREGEHELFDAAPIDPAKLKKEDLQAWLKEKGIEFPEDANKAALVALIPAAE